MAGFEVGSCSGCNNVAAKEIIERFKIQARNTIRQYESDDDAEIVIGEYYKDAFKKLQNLSTNEGTSVASCFSELNHWACAAENYNDNGLEQAVSSCALGEYTPPTEHGFEYPFFAAVVGFHITFFSGGLLPLGYQVQSFFGNPLLAEKQPTSLPNQGIK